MSLGRINWNGLLDYTIQPSDMELFQSYLTGRSSALLAAQRSPGVISGGVITPTAGLGISISAGLALMPDGTLIQFAALTATLAAADPTNPRIDRIELKYLATNNTQVLDVNSQSKTLDILNVVSLNVMTGTAAATPAAQNATSGNVSLGFVTVGANQNTLLIGNISQVVDTSLIASALQLGPTAFVRYNSSANLLQFSNDGIRYQALGSGGGGGGGGANWQGVAGLAPVETFEFDEKAFQFQQGQGQALTLFQKVPSSYLPGSPIHMKLSHYSPGSANDFLFQSVTTLIRKNQDPINSVANQYTSTNTDQVLSISYQSLEVIYDLSSPLGLIGGVTVSPGDSLKLTISRVLASGTDDSNDVRMIPSLTEVLFS